MLKGLKITAWITALALSTGTVALAEDATTTTTVQKPNRYKIEQRERRQQKRIAQGVESGQLTGKEAGSLEKKEANLEKHEDKMRASGGGLTPKERRRIAHRQDQLSKKIYREKHDNQTQASTKK